VGDDYYLVNSSFEFFPGVPIFHSRDPFHWQQIGHVLTRPEQLPLEKARSSGGIYAPTLRFHNGVYYMVTTNVTGGGNFFVTARDPRARDPLGPWSDPVWLDFPGIDPDLFFDDDGTLYLSGTGPGNGIHQTTIDPTTGKRLSDIRMIWPGSGGMYPEGPHLYKIDGTYYLMIAEGGTEYGHMITIARSQSPSGPFESCPHNPILSHRSQKSPIQATGHGDLFQDRDGRWWIVFLAVRPNGYPPCYHLGRETFLMPMVWDADGWPHIGSTTQGPARAKLVVEVPGSGPDVHPQNPPLRDDFDAGSLALSWNFLRNPHTADLSLSARPGWLRLNGSPVTLDDVDSPAFAGRRQEHLHCRVSTLLEFDPTRAGDEAGLTVLMNERHHYEIGVGAGSVPGEREVFVRRRIGSLSAVVARAIAPAGPIRLTILASADFYRFGFASGAGETTWLAGGETRYLSTEVAGGFTGVYFGLYAVSPTAAVHADFDWFGYEPLSGKTVDSHLGDED
jgi:alpha-N-arabinofuranosidase